MHSLIKINGITCYSRSNYKIKLLIKLYSMEFIYLLGKWLVLLVKPENCFPVLLLLSAWVRRVKLQEVLK